MPKWSVSTPSELCGDPRLGPHDFCMPSAKIERWLKGGHYLVTDAATSDSGLTAPYKLRLQIDDGPVISAKFKRAPDGLDSFNNSPRFEIAAYEIQKLILDEDEYVVPPTTLVCLPIGKVQSLMPDLKPHAGEDCAIGVLAYWLEGIDDKKVIDPYAWSTDQRYRDDLGKLNALTVLIGHQDSIGDNFYRSKDPARPRLFVVDNGLAFGAMGANPVQWFSSQWGSVRVPVLPAAVVSKLRLVDHAELERFRVVAELERKGGALVPVEPTETLESTLGVRRDGDIIQMGLTTDEITDVNVRLVKMLGEIDAGRIVEGVPTAPPP